MSDSEQKEKLKASSILRIILFVVLGIATVCLAGGYMGWIISGKLFFLVALPLLVVYLIVKAVENRRAYAANPVALTDEQREEFRSRGTFKAVLGLILLGTSFGILVLTHWDNIFAYQVAVLFCGIFMLLSLWPILGGVADLRKATRK